jgi:transposase InsO family protein
MKASVEHVREKFAFTERRACHLLLVPVSSYRYTPRRNDEGLRERLEKLAREKPRYGYRRLHVLLERDGEVVNHKRVYRIYREAGLTLRRKKRKRCVRVSTPLGVYTAANQEWALDFVHDVLAECSTSSMLTHARAWRWRWTRALPGCASRGCSMRSSFNADCRKRYGVTMARNSPAGTSWPGRSTAR